jgi:hypothetical protein
MKNFIKNSILVAAGLFAFNMATAQDIDNMRANKQDGTTQFEDPRTTSEFEKVRVRVGGNFAVQFQGLEHTNAYVDVADRPEGTELKPLGYNFNNATANLRFDVQLAQGVRMHLNTYLSSRHHPEAWVKGGYIMFDELPFLKSALVDRIMENVRIKVGHMEINYGDAHFRRTDNGNALYNPFVGNLIMDAFNTEVGGEIYYMNKGFMAMVGITNGSIKGGVVKASEEEKQAPTFLAKVGYDNMVAEDLRLRLTGSMYHNNGEQRNTLYGGDRSGSRYYDVMATGDFTSGRFNPGFTTVTSFMVNPFVQYKGLEFFGTMEMASGKGLKEEENRQWNQYAAELLYRFGAERNFYLGGRYNVVEGLQANETENVSIDRYQIGGGWFLTKNILTKVEYVNQNYSGFGDGSVYKDGNFKGFMVEAVIGF